MKTTIGSGLVDRMFRAARLEPGVYEEVEHDRSATPQAALIVVGTSLAAGVGVMAAGGVGGLVFGVLAGLLGWIAYAYITYLIGTRLLAGPDTRADWGELARTLGFANSPRVLLILGVVPILGALVTLVVGVWVLVATVVALRSALDFSTGKAIGTAVIGWIVEAVLFAMVYAFAR